VTTHRALALLAGALLLAGCGGVAAAGSPKALTPTTAGAEDPLTIHSVDPSKFLRKSSVGGGMGARPPIAAAVRNAAARAGCRVRADVSRGRGHLLNPDYSTVPRPPTNGSHRPIWANWGFYLAPLPYGYEVHNLEHGAVVIHLGTRIIRPQGLKVVRMWATSPPYLLIEPGRPADVPVRGVTVTSWQRAMICKTWNARTFAAIVTYRDTYRGTGPETVPSLNSGATAPDLPVPALADPSGA
jgi:hypothetical protein